ncbi:MAG TPA: glycosyltransferase family 4 protein [Cyclobacteriaceae bacterium]
MIAINYISNLSVQQGRGGWDGMNKNVYQQLKHFASVNLIDNVNPKVSFSTRLVSKIKRILGLPAPFPQFSLHRLNAIADEVEKRINLNYNFNFFHGSTPWLKVKNDVPYACYLDATFSTYLAIYHSNVRFEVASLIELERKFLSNAKAVFFSSQWSLEQTRKDYNLPGHNFFVAGLGGNLPYPTSLPIVEKKRFVFSGLDFKGKGGELVAEAFKIFSTQRAGFIMTFIGETPPEHVLKMSGVEYTGYLNKQNDNDLKRYQKYLSESIALVLPTSRDLTPLVIIEAGYYGCPSIATHAYGIPEIISEHGCLCEAPARVEDVVKAMMKLTDRMDLDQTLIQDFYQKNFTWDVVGARIKLVIDKLD